MYKNSPLAHTTETTRKHPTMAPKRPNNNPTPNPNYPKSRRRLIFPLLGSGSDDDGDSDAVLAQDSFENSLLDGAMGSGASEIALPPAAPRTATPTNADITPNEFITPNANGIIDAVINDAPLNQVPAGKPFHGDQVSTPITKSPSCHEIQPCFATERANRRNEGNHLVEALSNVRESSLARVSIKSSICTFLREPMVLDKFMVYKEFGIPSHIGVIKQTLNNWIVKSRHGRMGISMQPLLSLRDVLGNAPDALNYAMGRIWFEDYLLLEKGDAVTILVHPSHAMFREKSKTKTKVVGLNKSTIEGMIRANPFRIVTIGESRFFAIKGKVKCNPCLHDFNNANLTRKDLRNLLRTSNGAGIVFEAECLVNGEVTDHSFTIFYIAALESPLHLMFWVDDYQAGKRISQFKHLIDKYNDHVRTAAVVDVYMDYVFGDRMQSYVLKSYLQQINLKREGKLLLKNYRLAPVSDDRLKAHIGLASDSEPLREFKAYIDSVCKKTIDSLYGRFSTFASPILTQPVLTNFTNQFKLILPVQFKVLVSMIGKDDNKERTLKNKWLWDRYAFYQFVHMLRIRDTKNLTWWGMINAAAEYGKGSPISTFFGITTSHRTLLRNLCSLCPYDKITKRTVDTLQPLRFVIGTFDNSQLIRSRKFQRGGSSSSVTLVTSRMFLKAMVPVGLDLLAFSDDLVEITYLDQQIPSPFGMPRFEEIELISRNIFEDKRWVTNSSSMDTSGERVNRYAKVIQVAHVLSRMARLIPFWTSAFKFSNNEHWSSMAVLQVKERLRPLNKKRRNKEDSGLLRHVRNFQRNVTYSWRNGGVISTASALIPPVSPEDETTNIGAGQNVVSMLLLRGILEADDSDGAMGDMNKIRLAEDYEQKWLMLVGDGLTQIRIKTFVDIIQKSSFDFGRQQRITELIRKALGQIIHVTGDLHGGLFHFLSAIYGVFYGCLIQPIQELVAWKRICGSDVTKCYQQAAGLVMIISTELERQLFPLFVHEYCLSDESLTLRLSDDGEITSEDFAIDIAKRYIKWMDDKRSNTTDECFKMSLNFVKLCLYYSEFRLALSSGDAVMMEYLYREFLPIFLYTGKKHYFEIVCGMIEQFYGKIGNKLLQLVRTNRTVPLYRGKDTTGRSMSDHAIDAVIELNQKYYNQMNFKNDLDGWRRHSPHIQMTNKCRRFVQNEYSRCFSEEGKAKKNGGGEGDDIDVNRNKKQSAKPKRKTEHQIIAEFIQVNKLCLEVPGRSYSRRQVYSNMKDIKTKLADNDAEQKARWLEDAVIEEEQLLNDTVRRLFENQSEGNARSSINDDSYTNEIRDDEDNNNEVVMEFESIAFIDEDDENESAETETMMDTDLEVDDNPSVTEKDGVLTAKVGNGRRIRIRPSKVSNKAFRDVIAESRQAVMKKNLKQSRLRKKTRIDKARSRKRYIANQLLGRYANGTDANGTDDVGSMHVFDEFASKDLLTKGIERLERAQKES